MRKLNLVVTCSERKSLPVPATLQVRSLAATSPAERIAEWSGRLHGGGGKLPLTELYRGEHWAQVRGLLETARARGYEPTLWVASAGLGLRQADYRAPAYGATFAARQPDSVGGSADERRWWWKGLRDQLGGADLGELPRDGALMIVMSESYADALGDDLREAARAGGETLLVGGSADIDGMARVSSDRMLAGELGGTLASLNVRMATAWLERLHGSVLVNPQLLRDWGAWAASVASEPRQPGKPMRDDQIREFIALRRGSERSRTALLTELRASGYACEQGRFAALYREVRASA